MFRPARLLALCPWRRTRRLADYKTLQDFLFRYVARESGRLGLAVHIHAIDGAGAYYSQSGSDPLLLESVFNDQSSQKNQLRNHSRRLSVHERNRRDDKQAKRLCRFFRADVSYLSARAKRSVAQLAGSLSRQDSFRHRRFFVWAGGGLAGSRLALEYIGTPGARPGVDRDDERPRDHRRAQAVDLARMVLRDNAVKLYKLTLGRRSMMKTLGVLIGNHRHATLHRLRGF